MDISPKPQDTSTVYTRSVHGNSIRLLRFSKNGDGSFVGEIETFDLDKAPPFCTASYVWGEQTYTGTITFKSGELPLLTNLIPFLDMICEHQDFDVKDWWWIDSLSINQDDKKERAGQVDNMGNIYRRAESCIIWLGREREEDSDCVGALEFMKQLADLKASLEGSKALREQIREEMFAGQWAAVGRLLSRSWWRRCWTLQEFILPREAKFYCGKSALARMHFKDTMHCINLVNRHDYKLVPRAAFEPAWNRRRVHQLYTKSNGLSLVATIAYLGSHAATDARDRIYSVLGIITDRDRRMVGYPDYEATVQQTYSRLVRSFWEEYRSLEIICFAHLFNCYSGNLDLDGTEQNLPSWAPDWRAYVQSSPVPLMVSQPAGKYIGNFRPLNSTSYEVIYDASGPTLLDSSTVRFDENLKEMCVDATPIDTIDGLSGLLGCKPRCQSNICKASGHVMTQRNHPPISPNPAYSSSLGIIEAIACSLVLDRKDKYLRFRAPQHFASDFLVMCYACLNGKEVDELFQVWWEQNQALVVGSGNCTSGQTLDTVVSEVINPRFLASLPSPTVPPPSRIAESVDPNGIEESEDLANSFLERFYDTIRKKAMKLMVTRDGHLGMAPCRARQGDVVAIVPRCSVPLVLRRVESREAWQVVGEAYVHGFMNREIEQEVRSERKKFVNFRLV